MDILGRFGVKINLLIREMMDSENQSIIDSAIKMLQKASVGSIGRDCLNYLINDLVIFKLPLFLSTDQIIDTYSTKLEIYLNSISKNHIYGFEEAVQSLKTFDEPKAAILELLTVSNTFLIFTNIDIESLVGILHIDSFNSSEFEKMNASYKQMGYSGTSFFKSFKGKVIVSVE